MTLGKVGVVLRIDFGAETERRKRLVLLKNG